LMSNGLLLRKAGFLTHGTRSRLNEATGDSMDPAEYGKDGKDWCYGWNLSILGILLHKWMVSMVSSFEVMDLQLVRQSSDSVASDSNSCFACSFLGSLGPWPCFWTNMASTNRAPTKGSKLATYRGNFVGIFPYIW
jgi:hypothetical protein